MPRPFDRYDTFGAALDNPSAGAVLEELVPEVVHSSLAAQLRDFPLGPFLEFALGADRARATAVITALGDIENTTPPLEESPAIIPRPDYEADSVPPSSAAVHVVEGAEVNRPVELSFSGPAHGNPFVDVDLVAEFTLDADSIDVGGFYDGDGRYVVRFLPAKAGMWQWVTRSNARSLDGITGQVAVEESAHPGPVRVHDRFAFAHANGDVFTPVGTTAYAWLHQPEELQARTLDTLAAAPFNKLRMCVFPKSFLYNANEPDDFAFPRADDGTWDTERFDVAFFRRLEERIGQLDELGIQADVILFHPYDRWGFGRLGRVADERYLTYVVRRLSGFPNVWWSLANEYELLTTKRPEDWHHLGRVVVREDHVGHLLSIHNWSELFDYSAPWATHASIQRGDRELGQKIDEWRFTWGKPVIVDELGYEGDLDQGWGNLTAEEVVERFWSATVRGGYVTHGETFYRDDEEIFWSKGGTLIGASPARIDFLRRIVAESPTGRLEPLPSDWDVPWGGVAGQYAILYFGAKQPRFRDVTVPEGMTATIELIDTWSMTVEQLPGVHDGVVRVQLPARPYMAIRLRRA
ncbi:DUF5605 domain-containing protein [Microbacterium sp. NPDC019599]|uniref:DUF5605 domain-containing protein n=1 Tax=Microbacterium sp. NPDC019599 TaxID=3154690 RepID=UPI0033F18996